MAVIVSLLVTLSLGGCATDDDDATNSPADDDSVDDDSNDDDTTPPDAVSSATPGLRDKVLTSSHKGWKSASCRTCHEDVHHAGYTDPICASCHGSNGAPIRSVGHATDGCGECHSASHADAGFSAPSDCTVCHKYAESPECPATIETDVVVIGAGGGGLGAAASLAKAGVDVVVLEKQYKVGGYMTRFTRGDYNFEVSLHGLDGMDESTNGMNVGLWKQLGIWEKVKLIRIAPNVSKAVYPDKTVLTPAAFEDYRNMLKGMYPDEAAGIDGIFDEVFEIDGVFKALINIQNNGFNWTDFKVLISHPAVLMRILQYMNISLSEFMDKYIHNTELRNIWSAMLGFAGGGPDTMSALMYIIVFNSYYISGYYYPEGGSEAVSEALADVIRENGGTIRLNTLATKIDIQDNKAVLVHTKGDACYKPKYIVANNNAPDLFFKLIGEEHLPTDYAQSLKDMTIGLPCFPIYVGVDADLSEFFSECHEFSFSETWDPVESWGYINEGRIDMIGVAVTNYTKVDPTSAPPGKTALQLITYLLYDYGDQWQIGLGYDAYKEFKTDAAYQIIERAEQYIPGLRDHIEYIEVGTPLTLEGFTLNPGGTIFGWDNNIEQSMFNRLPQETPISNLLLAGAWTFPGGGQSAVIQSGAAAAKTILKWEQGARR